MRKAEQLCGGESRRVKRFVKKLVRRARRRREKRELDFTSFPRKAFIRGWTS